MFTKEEVSHALKHMHPTKALEPERLLVVFYQKLLHIIGEEVISLVLKGLNDNVDVRNLNHTFICLIPKVKKPRHAREFRPSSFCNVISKLYQNNCEQNETYFAIYY